MDSTLTYHPLNVTPEIIRAKKNISNSKKVTKTIIIDNQSSEYTQENVSEKNIVKNAEFSIDIKCKLDFEEKINSSDSKKPKKMDVKEKKNESKVTLEKTQILNKDNHEKVNKKIKEKNNILEKIQYNNDQTEKHESFENPETSNKILLNKDDQDKMERKLEKTKVLTENNRERTGQTRKENSKTLHKDAKEKSDQTEMVKKCENNDILNKNTHEKRI